MLVLGLGLVALVVLAAWRSPDGLLFVFLLFGLVTSLLSTPSWFPHYSAFVAVPLTALISLAGEWSGAPNHEGRGPIGLAALMAISATAASGKRLSP